MSTDVVLAAAPPVIASGLAAWLNDDASWNLAAICADTAAIECVTSRDRALVVATDDLIPTLLGVGPVRWDILAITRAATPIHEAALLRRGVAGVINVACDRDDFLSSLKAVSRGTTVATVEATRLLARSPSQILSSRQRTVLAMLGEGLSCSEIARRLCLSESTVKTHIARLGRLSGVRGTRALRAMAADLLSSA